MLELSLCCCVNLGTSSVFNVPGRDCAVTFNSPTNAPPPTTTTTGANYRAVWALHKHFPNLKCYARAHDVNHGINLEKAGASVVVPETLEPSLLLAAAGA